MADTNHPQVIPMLDYEDGPAAMVWLAQAFGFRELVRMMGDDGRLAHGEMAVDGGATGRKILRATAGCLCRSRGDGRAADEQSTPNELGASQRKTG